VDIDPLEDFRSFLKFHVLQAFLHSFVSFGFLSLLTFVIASILVIWWVYLVTFRKRLFFSSVGGDITRSFTLYFLILMLSYLFLQLLKKRYLFRKIVIRLQSLCNELLVVSGQTFACNYYYLFKGRYCTELELLDFYYTVARSRMYSRFTHHSLGTNVLFRIFSVLYFGTLGLVCKIGVLSKFNFFRLKI
jgi:hypothetical protein